METRAMTRKIPDKSVSFVEEEMLDHAFVYLLSQPRVITMRWILFYQL